jgi:hypothetical protein
MTLMAICSNIALRALLSPDESGHYEFPRELLRDMLAVAHIETEADCELFLLHWRSLTWTIVRAESDEADDIAQQKEDRIAEAEEIGLSADSIRALLDALERRDASLIRSTLGTQLDYAGIEAGSAPLTFHLSHSCSNFQELKAGVGRAFNLSFAAASGSLQVGPRQPLRSGQGCLLQLPVELSDQTNILLMGGWQIDPEPPAWPLMAPPIRAPRPTRPDNLPTTGESVTP